MNNGNKKNLGQTLYFSQFGGERPIPEAFIAAMARTEERTSGYAIDAELPEQDENVVEQRFDSSERRINEKVLVVVRKKSGNITLRETRTNDQGQPVQVVRTLMLTSYALTNPGIPTGTQSISDSDLGNGWTIREVGEEGTYVGDPPVFVPGIFAGNVYSRERPNLTPEEFRPDIPTVTSRVDSLGTAVDPTLSGTELREEQRQISEFKRSVEISTQAAPALPVIRDKGRDTNQQKQDVVVTRKLIADATAADSATALKDVSVKQLGDGNKVQETREVSSVFAETEYTKDIPDNVPDKFKVAVPTTESSSIVAGTAAPPTLGTGDLRKTEKQVTVFTKLIRAVTRATISVPVSLVGKETNQVKQAVTVTETYKDAGSDATPNATTDVAVQNLGDGRVVQTVKEVSEVFDEQEFVTERPETIPAKFIAAYPQQESSSIVESATAAQPSLSTPDLRKSEKRVTALTKLVRTLQRASSFGGALPINVDDKVLIREFGGATGTRTEKLGLTSDAGTNVLEDSLLVTESEVKNLGDGHVVRTTVKADGSEWPELSGTEVQERGLPVFYTEKVVPANTAGSVSGQVGTSVKPIDHQRSQKTTRTYPNTNGPVLYGSEVDETLGVNIPYTEQVIPMTATPPSDGVSTYQPLNFGQILKRTKPLPTSALDGYNIVFVGNTNIDFPPELTTVTAYKADLGEGAGAYSAAVNDYSIASNGSGAVSLHGEAEANVVSVVNVTPKIKQPWGVNVPCKHYLFFKPANTPLGSAATAGSILKQLTDGLGADVLQWPKFVPEQVTILTQGQKASRKVTADIHASDSIHVDYAGVIKKQGTIRTSGGGDSIDVAVNLHTERIPATIHKGITISQPGSRTATASAYSNLTSGPSGATYSSTSLAVTATGGVVTTGITATKGTQSYDDIPANTLYLYRLFAEPYRAGYIKYHAEIVNSDDFNPP